MYASTNEYLFWITFITPSIIIYTLEFLYDGRIKDEKIYETAHLHEVLTAVQSAMMVYICFVPFYSDRFPVWDKIGYVLHMIAIHIMFIVCPIIVIVHTAIYVTRFYDSPARGWLFTFALMNVLVLIYYFTVFLKFVRGITKFYKNRKHMAI